MSTRGIGRGLAAILPETGVGDPDYRELPTAMVRPNPGQPRKRFDPESISTLAESISEAGMIQPILVRPMPDGRFELIAGERRWRAAREAGLEMVPALIRDDDAATRMQTALIENVAREDLNPVDEARACAALVEDLGLTKEELARRLGRSRESISNLVRLLDLPDDVLDFLSEGRLTAGHGRAILIAKGTDVRRRLARDAVAAGWSVRETERRANDSRYHPLAEGGPASRSAGGADTRRGRARTRARHGSARPPNAQGAARGDSVRRPRRPARVRPRGRRGAPPPRLTTPAGGTPGT